MPPTRPGGCDAADSEDIVRNSTTSRSAMLGSIARTPRSRYLLPIRDAAGGVRYSAPDYSVWS